MPNGIASTPIIRRVHELLMNIVRFHAGFFVPITADRVHLLPHNVPNATAMAHTQHRVTVEAARATGLPPQHAACVEPTRDRRGSPPLDP